MKLYPSYHTFNFEYAFKIFANLVGEKSISKNPPKSHQKLHYFKICNTCNFSPHYTTQSFWF